MTEDYCRLLQSLITTLDANTKSISGLAVIVEAQARRIEELERLVGKRSDHPAPRGS